MKIAPPSLPPVAGAEAAALIEEARRRQRRRYLLTGLAAAVVLAGAAGIIVGQIGPGGRPPVPAFVSARLAGSPARYSSAPAYYAYTVQRDIYNYVSHGTQYSMSADRYIKIRGTATGKLLATISPPKPYNVFGPLTADANGNTFVLAERRIWQRNAGPSPKLAERNQRTPMKFLLVHITPRGHLQQAVLSLPETVTPAQIPTMALSPDGTKLAVAFGGRGQTAAVQVTRLATGKTQRWMLPRASWTPVLNGEGAWTADGRTLAFQQQFISPPQLLRHYHQPATTRVRMLNTTGLGTSLASSKLLVLRPPAGESAPAQPFLTPDGTKLIGPVGKEPFGRGNRPSTGELAVYSARTGALLHTLAPWVWRWPSPPGRGGNPQPTVAWSNRTGSQLIMLQPRDDLNILVVLVKSTFTQARNGLLPPRPSAYQELQYALRIAPQITW